MTPSPTLFVVLASEYSGAETLQEPVLRADPDPLMACPPGSSTERWAHGLGVGTVALTHRTIRSSAGRLEAVRSALRMVGAARELRAILRARPERSVVVGTSVRPSALASLAALGLRRRTVVWMITDLLPGGAIGFALRLLARTTRARVVCISRFVEQRTFPGRAVISHPGVEAVEDGDEAAGAPREPRCALLVGHVSPTKRTDLAVDIAVRVGREVPDFRLDVIGRAQYREEDHALERRLHERARTDPEVGAHVAFVGHVSDVRRRMATGGLLLHTRTDEPFGMVLLEAMAQGLPVVAPASAGPLEIVQDGVTGLLYPPGDAQAAADAVIRIVRDEALARRLGEAGRARCREAFAARRQVDDFAAVIDASSPSASSR